MDPNACLAEIRRQVKEQLYGGCECDAERLAELVEALDDWIRKGGFLPKDWQKGSEP